MNKLIHYMGENVSFGEFFRALAKMKKITTASGKQEIEIIDDTDFFLKLKKVGVTKSDKSNPNLCRFLCIDVTYPKVLMLRKIKKCLLDFNSNGYMQSVGLKKMKIEDADKN